QRCLWFGTLIPGLLPIYVALWVDDFIYFSASRIVERQFELVLSSKVKVDFMGDVEFFLGTQFQWSRDTDGNVKCHMSQNGYINMLIDKMDLREANTSPRATPYRSGLTIDSLPTSTGLSNTEKSFQSTYRTYVGMLNWLAICTRPDISTVTTLLATYQSAPTAAHVEAARHVGRYLKSTPYHGITFSTKGNSPLKAFLHFDPENSPDQSGLIGYADANWGPQDASRPNSQHSRVVTMTKHVHLPGISSS
ncbi:MAG: hypothetical protein ACREBR_01715, partial [bacterium]